MAPVDACSTRTFIRPSKRLRRSASDSSSSTNSTAPVASEIPLGAEVCSKLGNRATGGDIVKLYGSTAENLNEYLSFPTCEPKDSVTRQFAQTHSYFTMRLLSFLTEIERAI